MGPGEPRRLDDLDRAGGVEILGIYAMATLHKMGTCSVAHHLGDQDL